MIAVLIGFSSCQETGQEEIKVEIQEKLKEQDPIAYENKLKELTLFMGEVFKDPEARRELFEFAEIKGNENDIEYSMKRLFTENTNPLTRQHSAIVSAFFSKAENLKTTEETTFNEQELIDFINENDIGILAPYLYENFDPESITELTVSWWTEEKELEELRKNPDWDGETPGYKFNINEDEDFSQLRLSVDEFLRNELVYANDDYALDNPTVVFGSFGDDASLDPGDGGIIGDGGNPNPTPNLSYPHEIGVDCDNVQSNDIVRWMMENFRITGNTRGWPHPNRITMWVNSASNPTSAPFFGRKKIVRGDFEWKTDFIPNNGTIATTWEQFNYNQNLIIGVKRPANNIDEQTIVYNTDSQGNPVLSSTLKIERARTYLVSNQSWARCAELNWNYLVDNDNGFFNDEFLGIWAYDVDRKGYEIQFTVAPKIVRFNP